MRNFRWVGKINRHFQFTQNLFKYIVTSLTKLQTSWEQHLQEEAGNIMYEDLDIAIYLVMLEEQ